MPPSGITVRLMAGSDFTAVVDIDEKVHKSRREKYYDMKFEKLVHSIDYVPTSLVAVTEGGKVAGFVMGGLFVGEYGISQELATLDTIGVDPEFQGTGIGELLLEEYIDHLKAMGVEKLNTLVDEGDQKLTGFFASHGFGPSKTINLERSLLQAKKR